MEGDRMPDSPGAQHNFLTVIQQMWASGALPRSCGYHHCHIAHDGWCGWWTGQRCNCDVEVSLAWSLPAHSEN